MTNAEKYLKEGVDSRYFATDLYKFILTGNKNSNEEHSILNYINTFLSLPVTPTLTEDERVILMNMEKVYTKIERTPNGHLEVSYKPQLNTRRFCDLPYDHLFQFIKERRRIRDRGIIK